MPDVRRILKMKIPVPRIAVVKRNKETKCTNANNRLGFCSDMYKKNNNHELQKNKSATNDPVFGGCVPYRTK
jgi:hypothetical protein